MGRGAGVGTKRAATALGGLPVAQQNRYAEYARKNFTGSAAQLTAGAKAFAAAGGGQKGINAAKRLFNEGGTTPAKKKARKAKVRKRK